jgi:phosphoribosyl 1,2-cyclic phosphodiesterase
MVKQQRFLVRFWGVRGSYPTPGPETLRHGGNTSCVEVQAGPHTLIFDAGTGIIRLGETLLQQSADLASLDLALFFTHAHGDHLVGFPFFAPLFDARTHLHLFGPKLAGRAFEELVTTVMSPPYFPVDVRQLPSQRTCYTVHDALCISWHQHSANPTVTNQYEHKAHRLRPTEVHVTTRFTNSHPLNGAVIYRIDYAGRHIVYATDVEWKDGCDPDFLAFIEGADLLIHDAQYTVQDYQQSKQGFGHSTVEMAVETAQLAHVHKLILFHHEPTYDDNQLDRLEAEAQRRFAHTLSAYEGMEIDLLT